MLQHEPTDGCRLIHCYSHMVDEPDHWWSYIVCPECNHVYRTAGELRREYRRQFWRTSRPGYFPAAPSPGLLFEAVPVQDMTLIERAWTVLTIRASKIGFCQHCIHDF